MADQSITQLPVAQTVTGNEVTVIVQSGITKQVAISLIGRHYINNWANSRFCKCLRQWIWRAYPC